MDKTSQEARTHLMELREEMSNKRHLSNLGYIQKSEHYREIIKMGTAPESSSQTLKLLFDDLKLSGTWEVIIALIEILKFSIPDKASGNLELLRNELLVRGKNLGYL